MRIMEFLSPTIMKSMRFMSQLGTWYLRFHEYAGSCNFFTICFVGNCALGMEKQSKFRMKTKYNRELSKRVYRQHNAYVMHVSTMARCNSSNMHLSHLKVSFIGVILCSVLQRINSLCTNALRAGSRYANFLDSRFLTIRFPIRTKEENSLTTYWRKSHLLEKYRRRLLFRQ